MRTLISGAKRGAVFCAALSVLFLPAWLFAAEKESLWPKAPVVVSPTEGVIESFWDSRLKSTDRWTVESGEEVSAARLVKMWDGTYLHFDAKSAGATVSIRRPYAIDIGDYQRLLLRTRPGEAVQTTVIATVDGITQTVAQVAGSNRAMEVAGPIQGRRLTGVIAKFKAEQAGPQSVMLRWVMLDKPGVSWAGPAKPFEGMVVERSVKRFEPGLGLVFDGDELRRMREKVLSPEFTDVWAADMQHAAEQYDVDPVSLIRRYSLYATKRYGRIAEEEIDLTNDGMILALVGLITKNEDYMRQAARHAMVFAHIEQWAEGFVDRFPAGHWYHSGFAPNTATIRASLLLDWTWHWLTPEARATIRASIRDKGIRRIEPAKNAMANQGVRFNKGLILGQMALADSFDDPELRASVQTSIDLINAKLDAIIRPDGTFSEGMGYGKGTLAATMLTYHVASRCLDRPIGELVSAHVRPALRFIYEADGTVLPTFAAFAAGPLGEEQFGSQCVASSLFEASGYGYLEMAVFGAGWFWSPTLNASPQPPTLPRFSAYRDGGWVFMGADEADGPRISFESGLWDGHGHAWMHKHAITLDAWGEQLLVTRHILPYDDARSEYTMKTKLYNTFSPAERDEDPLEGRGRGAKLSVAEDLGSVSVIESDNATAWKHGVKKAIRRMVFLRPAVMIVQEEATFDEPETGVQSWNSFGAWQIVDEQTCESRLGESRVRLRAIGLANGLLTAGQDSVHRGSSPNYLDVPVYRAALTSPAATSHEMLTVIEAIGPDSRRAERVVTVLDGDVIVVRQGDVVARVATGPVAPEQLFGCSSDGRLTFAVRTGGKLAVAGAFGATWLETPAEKVRGEGFVYWSSGGE